MGLDGKRMPERNAGPELALPEHRRKTVVAIALGRAGSSEPCSLPTKRWCSDRTARVRSQLCALHEQRQRLVLKPSSIHTQARMGVSARELTVGDIS